MKEYILYETNWDTCTIETMQGRKFKINNYDMSIVASWNPTAILIFNETEKTLMYEASGQKVRVK